MARIQCFMLEPTAGERTHELANGGAIHEPLYRRTDTGELTTIKEASAGAMFRAPWYTWFTSQDDGAPLCVKLPNGWQWCIDEQASNCGMPDDGKQEHHHCWVRHGEPPNITVDKSGTTCSAGAGSIAVPGYHGFPRGGCLEEC